MQKNIPQQVQKKTYSEKKSYVLEEAKAFAPPPL